MKKVSKNLLGFLSVLTVCFFFTNCENFLSGSSFKDQLAKDVDYANSPHHKIKVEAVKNTGTIKVPSSGEVEKKVSDTFTVKFDPSDNCKFIKWEACSPTLDAKENISDYITFENETSLETKVTFKKAKDDLLIRPVCPEKLAVTNFNLNDADKSYPKDSTIVLTFNKELNADSLENILIRIPGLPKGKTFRDYYKDVEVDGNMIVFSPKIDWDNVSEEDFIPLSKNETKLLSVFVPALTLSYTNTNYSLPITSWIESDLEFPFVINSDTGKGPEAEVILSGNHGNFSPLKGSYSVKQFLVNDIEFEPESDYEFIRWQIFNAFTGEEIENDTYLRISDPASEKTSYKLIEDISHVENLQLGIRPLVAERPQVISNAPLYSSNGVLRDTTIQVMFDYDMDENSIYYSDEDLMELSLQGVDWDKILSTRIGEDEKYYGYVSEEGITYFKNISIINSRNNANLIDNFKAPVFDNPRTLSIPVEGSLAPGMNVMVTLDKGFFRTLDEKKVTMSQSKKWLYLVNGDLDDTPPSFDSFSIYDLSYTQDQVNSKIDESTKPTLSSENVNTLHFIKGEDIYLALKVRDNVAPSSNFDIEVTKVYDSTYTALATPVTETMKVSYSICYGLNAVYGDETSGDLVAELCHLKDLSDGVYGLAVKITDGSGNDAWAPDPADSKFYYFSLDSTAPDIPAPSVSNGDTATSLVLNWNKGLALDYKNTVIRWRKWGSEENYSSSEALTGDTYTITGLTEGTHYEILAEYSDYAGNTKYVSVENGAYTRPGLPKNLELSAEYGTEVTIACEYPDLGNCTNIRIRYKREDNSNWTEYSDRITEENPSLTITPVRGHKYSFEICSYDEESGKYSFPYYTSGTSYPEFTASPNEPTLESFTISPTTLDLSWRKASSGNTSGYIAYVSTNAEFPNTTETKTQTISDYNIRNIEFSGLTQGTLYYVKVLSYYDSLVNTASSRVASIYTKCAAVTNLRTTQISNSSIDLAWAKPAGNYKNYQLDYKKHSESSYISYGTISKEKTSVTVSGLNAGEYYDFKLYTIGNGTADSNSSEITNINTYPNPVENLTAEKVLNSNTSYVLSWKKPSSGEYDGYKYYVASSVAGLSSASPTTVNKSSEVSGTIVLNKTASANALLYIKVSTYRGSLETESDPIVCSLGLDSVKNLTASALSKTEIKLTWTNPLSTGYEGLRIYRGSTLLAATNASGSTSSISKTATSYTATGLTVNTQYTFTVVTYKNDTSTSTELTAESIVSRYTLANPATSFIASAAGPTSVNLTWAYPATGTYKTLYIYRNDKTDGHVDWWNSSYLSTTSSTYTVPTGGTSYTFRMVSTNGNDVQNTADQKTYTITTPPSPVTGLETTSTATTSVTLSWTKPTGNFTGVKVYKKLSGASSWTLFNTYANTTTTSCSVTGLTAGNTYDFKVESYLSNVSNVGETSSATLLSVDTKPYSATSFSLSTRTSSSLKFTWVKPSGGISGYVLYYKKSSASSYTTVSLSSSTTYYTISNLSQGTIYNAYLISYYNSESNYTATSTLTKATLPGIPGSYSVAIDGDGTKVSWSSPTNGSTGYYVYYRTGSGSYSSVYTTNTYYRFANTSLTNGANYSFYVKAYNTINSETLYSDATSTKTIYTPPKALSFTTNPYIYKDDGMGTVTLRWVNTTGRSDVAGIKIYIDNSSSYDKSVSFTNGATSTATITIPDCTRSSSHYFRFEPYHNKNSTEAKGPRSSYYLTVSDGDLMINGTTITKTRLINVVTSDSGYTIRNNTTEEGGSFTEKRVLKLTKYSIGQYEVTNELYNKIMGSKPSYYTNDKYPVTNVSYYHAIAFCNKLSVLQGLTPCYTVSGITDWLTITHSSVPTSNNVNWSKATLNMYANGYHLPTEAQWEFAGRGGSTAAADWSYWCAGKPSSADSSDYAVTGAKKEPLAVGSKYPNRLGLYDMTGNVWEWTTDWNNSVPSGTLTDPYCGYSTVFSETPAPSTMARKTSSNVGILLKGSSFRNSSNRDLWYNSYVEPPHYIKCIDKSDWNDKDYSTYGFRLCRNVTY